MKVIPINNNYQKQVNVRKSTNFKGYINDKLINNAINNVPKKLLELYEKNVISCAKYNDLMKEYGKIMETIKERLEILHPDTRLETFNNIGKYTAVLVNDSSNYAEPLDFRFYSYFDDHSSMFHNNLKHINNSPETDVEILSDLAECLKKLDGLKVDATMALYSKEPSFRDAVLKRWEGRYLKKEDL